MRELSPLSLCIVNHDGEAHLAKSLPTVLARQRLFAEIMLLDNASQDDSVGLFRRVIPDGIVIALPENRSPGTARNAGIRRARHDLILFIDNDIRLTDGAVEALCEALLAEARAVVAAPRVIYADNPSMIQYQGADAHFLGHMILRLEGAAADAGGTQAVKMNSLVTAAFLLHRARWPGAAFDGLFEFYLEDHDFGLRARLAGHELLAVGRAVVIHGGGTPGLSLRPGGSYGSRRIKSMIAGRWQVLIKNYSVRSLLVLGPCLVIYECAQLLGVISKGWWREWWSACCWVRVRAGRLRAARNEVQATRRVRDRDLLQGGPIPFKPELARSRAGRAAITGLNMFVSAYWLVARHLL
jgi:GT2 family glycosyltransferase